MSELLKTIAQHGDCEFPGDDANIPVNIFLVEISDDSEQMYPEGHKWRLTADNFMPRKGHAGDSAYEATAPTREALAELIRTQILPLYEVAVLNLKMMVAGTNDFLYYWHEPKPKEQT